MSLEIPKTMKAIRVHELGGTDKNQIDEIPVPVPADDEVLIKVLYSGANFVDEYFRTGLFTKPTPFVVGQDVVGIVVSLPKVEMVKTELPPLEVGQLVVSPTINAFAEYATSPWFKCAPIPKGIDPKSAVAHMTNGLTAYALIKGAYEIKKGDFVFIRAVAGGVGIPLGQIARKLGATVIGTTSTAEKAKLVKEYGAADHVIIARDPSEETVKKTLELSGGEGVHVIYDGVGLATWDENFDLLRFGGWIVNFGNSSGKAPLTEPLRLWWKSFKIAGIAMNPYVSTPEKYAAVASQLFKWQLEGTIKYILSGEYPFTLEGVKSMQEELKSGKSVGKLLLKVAEQ